MRHLRLTPHFPDRCAALAVRNCTAASRLPHILPLALNGTPGWGRIVSDKVRQGGWLTVNYERNADAGNRIAT